jgi:hypothetical protein
MDPSIQRARVLVRVHVTQLVAELKHRIYLEEERVLVAPSIKTQ